MVLTAGSLSKSFGENVLFEDASFKIEEKDIIGFVGANGCGKTTLFKIILGLESSDTGGVARSNGVTVGCLQQHACEGSLKTAFFETLSVFDELINMESQLQQLSEWLEIDASDDLIEKQHSLNERFVSEGGLVYKAKTKSALIGLGLSEEELSLPVNLLSGGQKSKVGLCKLLLSSPKLMLLDEPTNHLDIEATAWLEDYILSFSGSAVIISHDRYFLDRVTNKTWEIEHGSLLTSEGNFSRYLELKAERELAEQRVWDNTMKEVKRIEGIIEQQRQFNREKNIKTAESKQKQIDRMVKDLKEPEKALKGVSMKFTAKVRSGNDVLEIENESATFDQRILYKNLSFSLKRGERAFIIGANGCGKTTLLKAILAHGEKNKFGSMVSVGYFDQHGGNIDKSKTVFGELRDSYPSLSDTEIRNALAMFLFKQEEVFSKIEDLSGGERARVSLCKLMLSGDNLLLLDEPTNHLDLRSRMALENALEGYDGTILAVSHDRYFINKLATKILSLMPTKIETTLGNYDDFLAAGVESSKPEKMLKSESVNKIQYKQKKECQASLRKCENAMLRSEKAIEDFEESIASVETELQSPEVATDYQKTLELSARLHEQNDKLLLEMEVWERLAAELEDLRKMEEQA